MRISHETITDNSNAPSRLQPGFGRERFLSIDYIRGVALLFFTPLLIELFSFVTTNSPDSTQPYGLTGTGGVIWMSLRVFNDQTFLMLISIAFGAGLVASYDKHCDNVSAWRALQQRRMWALIGLGFLAYILFGIPPYLSFLGLAGIALLRLTSMNEHKKRRLGLIALVAQPLLMMALIGFAYHIRWETLATIATYQPIFPATEQSSDFLALKTSFAHALAWRFQLPGLVHIFLLTAQNLIQVLGFALLGQYFFQNGHLRGQVAASRLMTILIGGLTIGLPISIIGIIQSINQNWDPFFTLGLAHHLMYVGQILTSCALLAFALLIFKYKGMQKLTRALVASGRGILTHTSLMTICLVWVYFPIGMGRAGLSTWNELMIFGGLIAVFQLIASPLWLRYFHFGPIEWALRTWLYDKRLPMPRLDRLMTF